MQVTDEQKIEALAEALRRCVQRLEGDWDATREVEFAREALALIGEAA